ncbi:hypothetical protein BS78_05G111800 [Paspalum vaginatum]|nr:hypothetical protein BS78_05G111800 [Paspalum vaginatum]
MGSDALALLDHVTYLGTQRSAAAASASGSAVAAAAGEDDGCCAICLGAFEGGDWCNVMPLCGHEFHRGCMEGWLRTYKTTTCPLCRAQLQWKWKPVRGDMV